MRTNKIKKELNEIKKWEEKNKRNDLRYGIKSCLYDFQQYDTIRSFGKNIYGGKINMDESEMDQTNLFKNWKKLSEKSKPRTKTDRDKKLDTFDSINPLYEGRELLLNAFRSRIFPIKRQGEGLKILTPKKMLQRLPIALAQVKADNNPKIY